MAERVLTVKNGVAVLLGIIAVWCSFTFFFNRACGELEIEVTEATLVKIYWKKTGENYTERNRVYFRVHPQQKNYKFFLANLENIDLLRFDPVQYAGKVTVKRLKLIQGGYKDVVFDAGYDFATVKSNEQLKIVAKDTSGIHIESTGVDPYFIFSPKIVHTGFSGSQLAWLLSCLLLVFFFFWTSVHSTWHLGEDFRFVPLLLSGALLVIVLMSAVSAYNSHPDEYVHWAAIEYCQDHWMPPAYDDPEIRNTYSSYGVSRLNSGEIYYDLAGKFKRLISGFRLPGQVSTRLFNNLLFVIIVLMAFRSWYGRLLAIPLLVSPQIWYLFSYANSDAFAVFIAYCCGVQLVDPGSSLNSFLGCKGRATIGGLLFLGLLFGAMFLLKKNYYFFIAFFYCLLFLHCYYRLDRVSRRRALRNLAFITCAGAIFFGVRTGMDYKINGLDKKEKLAEIREVYAGTMYKKNVAVTGEQQTHLYMKERGVPFRDVVVKDRWFEKSFRSSFGEYGYMDVSARENYYNVARILGGLAFLFFFGSVLIHGGNFERMTAFATLFFSAVLIGTSLMHSWIYDFQAQGRYLFPIVGMLGICFGMAFRAVNKHILILLVTMMYFMSLYSYVFVAIYQIPKI